MNYKSYMDQGELSDQEINNTIHINNIEEDDEPMRQPEEDQPSELIPKQGIGLFIAFWDDSNQCILIGKLIGEEFLKKYFITLKNH